MKKKLALVTALALMFTLAGCSSGSGSSSGSQDASSAQGAGSSQNQDSSSAGSEPVEVIVFAAASLEASLTQIADLYQEVAPNVTLTFSFESSGTLRTQIKEGATCDLFISAGQSQMDDVDAAQGGEDLADTATRIALLENKVVLAVPDDNPKGITAFTDLATDKLSLLCIGNDDVPVGGYSLEILDTLGISVVGLEAEGKITYATNVTEVANQVKEGAVDAGIIYATDANTYGLTVVAQATEDLCGQVIYPAAVMKCGGSAASMAAAQAFLDWLHTDAGAVGVLENVGFTVL